MKRIAVFGIAAALAVAGVLGFIGTKPPPETTLDLSFETLQKAKHAGKVDEVLQFTEEEEIDAYFEQRSPQEVLEFAVELGQYVDDGNGEILGFFFVVAQPLDKKVLPLLTFADLEHLMTAGVVGETFQLTLIEMITHQDYPKLQPNPSGIDEILAKVATDPAQKHVIQEQATTSIYDEELATKILIQKYDEAEDKEKAQTYLRTLKDYDKEAYEERYQAYLDWKKSRRRK